MSLDRRRFLTAVGAVGGGLVVGGTGCLAAARPEAAAPDDWRALFPALDQHVNGKRLTYLDSAATTLRPRPVIDALSSYYTSDNANPSRVHTLASRAGARLADARKTVARFVNAATDAEIIFVRGTTEGMNLVAGTWGAQVLGPGDELVTTVAEHSSNLMPWTRAARQAGARVTVIGVDDEGALRLDELERALARKPRVFAFSHVSNVLGLVNPAKRLCEMARAAGTLVAIDGAQGAPHVPIDVQDLGCDFYVFSGHKMLGPMGTGVVWGRIGHLEAMPPYHVGSNMAHDVTVEDAAFEHGAQKFQAGTPDVAGPVGLAAAVDLFGRMGAEALWAHDQRLVRHALARLAGIPRVRLIGPRTAADRIPVLTFAVEGADPAAVARTLDAEGIAVRAGDMAALPLLRRFGVERAVRASAYVYSTEEDIDRLASALRRHS